MLIYFDLEINANNKVSSIGATTDLNINFVSNDEIAFLEFINKHEGSFFVVYGIIEPEGDDS